MRSPLSYAGGKNRFISKILPLIPPHLTYVEPFVGGGQIFFHKVPSKVEVINDLDGELVNFYRVCQAHPDELARYMQFLVASREWYSILERTPSESLTDVQRAARYFVLQKCAYGGKATNRRYVAHVMQAPNFSREHIRKLLDTSHERLARTQIESLPYQKIIQKYDRLETFFYVDPPYYGVRGLYRFDFSHQQFEELARLLQALKGKFLLSVNDHPEVRRMFSAFRIEAFAVAYSLQPRAGRRYGELLIRNY